MDKPVVKARATDPLWYKDAIIYETHVKVFFDSNRDGIGDFPGLIDKLDYLQDLGVTCLWLLPFFPSPLRDDGYDIADYENVHPSYGTLEDFKRLLTAAHDRNLQVIIELVINHTSDRHPWFQRAREAPPNSPERDFYVWSDSDKKYSDVRVIFVDTEKSNWTWDPVANAYYWHRFYAHQPDLNFDNPRVLEEVLDVMRYWLDLGVDGLRLDAIPYLVEREGTNNENLPETHAVLKRIRAEIDAAYPDRMLLAEANQWPEDAQLYFGDGDECHMAFHFPLMPRMYMSIAQEDRFPITDILRQTPDIPPNAQWAIFLRNHDELTLEMVTDAERDYLWNIYASDRRARLNLGIRRRLAPLLQHDRRRIELMNGLLLSMPGTPGINYGGEIGMGDNIHLGDRDGVRTPMQWTEDRNGGFSRADPASIVLPPIRDPLYGYAAVNVEAQTRDQHSFLNWMRRMLTLRSNHKVFGRGAFQFLYPRNRRILAYLRQYDDETVLCVANLARTPQAVELDLSEFAGRVPVELTGPSPFPPIGQLSYLLTMPPYAFYWFELRASSNAAPSWRDEPPEQLPEFQTLVVRESLRELLCEHYSRTILHDLLPAYLQRRRWFAAKNETISSVRIAYEAQVPSNREIILTEIVVRLRDRAERYFVPAGIACEGAAAQLLPQQLAMARFRRGGRVGFITDAFSLEALPRAIMGWLRERAVIPTREGEIRCLGEPGIDALPDMSQAPIRWLATEQSNSSLIIGNAAMIKLVRRVLPGVHPEVEMTRRLSICGFANAPQLLGEIVRVDPKTTPYTLFIIQSAIQNQGDAWTWMVDNLRRALEDAALEDEAGAGSPHTFSLLNEYVVMVGRRLGEMHVALAAETNDPAFAPEVVDDGVVCRWAKEAAEQIERGLNDLDRARQTLDPERQALADSVLARRENLMASLPVLAEHGRGGLTIRIHG